MDRDRERAAIENQEFYLAKETFRKGFLKYCQASPSEADVLSELLWQPDTKGLPLWKRALNNLVRQPRTENTSLVEIVNGFFASDETMSSPPAKIVEERIKSLDFQ